MAGKFPTILRSYNTEQWTNSQLMHRKNEYHYSKLFLKKETYIQQIYRKVTSYKNAAYKVLHASSNSKTIYNKIILT